MTVPALALIPVLTDPGTGSWANFRTLDDELLDRASREDYQHWLSAASAAGGCIRPIRLRGTIRDIDAATGELLHRLNTGVPLCARRAQRPTALTPTSSSAPD